MQSKLHAPSEENQFRLDLIESISRSYLHWTGNAIIKGSEPDGNRLAKRLYLAEFVLAAHQQSADPIFYYANQTAQRLFELSLAKFISLSSRFSAEQSETEHRQEMLDSVLRYGYINNYTGMRKSSTGRKFNILDAELWNVLNEKGVVYGQAVKFKYWQFL